MKQTLEVGEETLAIHCADALDCQARSLLTFLGGLRGQGKGLADGVTVEVGWSVLTLRRRGPELVVCEPDFSGDPFRDVRADLSCTLTVLAGQVAVLNRLGIEGVPARFDDKVVLARGSLSRRRVYLQRTGPRPGDSGWYVGPAGGPAPEKKAENYESLPVYGLLGRRPALLEVLALPPGYLAVFDGERIEAVVDGENRDVWSSQQAT